jgi:hypothetical protein
VTGGIICSLVETGLNVWSQLYGMSVVGLAFLSGSSSCSRRQPLAPLLLRYSRQLCRSSTYGICVLKQMLCRATYCSLDRQLDGTVGLALGVGVLRRARRSGAKKETHSLYLGNLPA